MFLIVCDDPSAADGQALWLALGSLPPWSARSWLFSGCSARLPPAKMLDPLQALPSSPRLRLPFLLGGQPARFLGMLAPLETWPGVPTSDKGRLPGTAGAPWSWLRGWRARSWEAWAWAGSPRRCPLPAAWRTGALEEADLSLRPMLILRGAIQQAGASARLKEPPTPVIHILPKGGNLSESLLRPDKSQ